MRVFFIPVIILTFCLLTSFKATSQNIAAGNQTISNAVSFYHKFMQPEAGLYNGTEYIEYAYTIQNGSPFFMTVRFANGSVVYNNMLYLNVPLLYDVVKGEVVINDAAKLHKISLLSERVTQFSIAGNQFVRLTKDSTNQSFITTGFYQLLYAGKSRLYKKQTKTVQENLSVGAGLERYIDESKNYYLEKNNTFYIVNNKAALAAAMQDKKKAMQQFIKKNKKQFKANKEAALINTVMHYDE